MSPHFLREECETIMEVKDPGLTTEPRFLPSVNYFIAPLYLLSDKRLYSKCINWKNVSCNHFNYSPTHNKEIDLSPTYRFFNSLSLRNQDCVAEDNVD